MKVLLIYLSVLVLSPLGTIEKDKCAKAFLKNKKSKGNSELFSDTIHLQTKYCTFYGDTKRSLSFSFLRNDSSLFLEFASIYMREDGFKRKFVLGPDMAIGFFFKNGTTTVIRFEGAEQRLSNYGNATSNRIQLSDSLLLKFMTTEIIKFEIQNPFGQLNQSKVFSESLSSKQSKKILQISHCFYDRVK